MTQAVAPLGFGDAEPAVTADGAARLEVAVILRDDLKVLGDVLASACGRVSVAGHTTPISLSGETGVIL